MAQKCIEKVKHSPLTVPVVILVICVLAYGLLIPHLGFYWDDLPYALVNHRFGPGGYVEFVSSDRPHSAWVFMVLTWLLGEQPLGYHVVGILVYWVCAILFWKLIRLIWPGHAQEALWATLFFAIYPGFLGHPQAIIYNHHFSAMALYLFSLVATVKAVKRPGKGLWWHLPAVLAMSLSQFSIEYYIGWEVVRPIVIWLVLQGQFTDHRRRLHRGLWHVAPYWVATLGFLAWRLLIFQFPTYQPVSVGQVGTAPLTWLLSILTQTYDAVFGAWVYAIPNLSSQAYSSSFWLVYIGLIVLATGLVFIVLYHLTPGEQATRAENDPDSRFGLPALLIALAGIGFAGWPFWLVGLQLSILSHFRSRFTLAFIPWTALLLAVLLHYFLKLRFRWVRLFTLVLVSLVVGGSIGWHLWNANYYRNQWVETQRYFQQLVRRAPGLEPGTTLVVNDMRSITLYQDDSLSALLIWTYSPEDDDKQLDYMMQYLSVRLGNYLPALEPGLPIEQWYRSMYFVGSTDQLIVAHYDPPGCLRLLDSGYPDRAPLTLTEEMQAALPLSNIELISTGQVPTAEFPNFFSDLDAIDTWCLYFQEAELAAQQGDWGRVAVLGDLAYAGEDQPNELSEHFVFIDGYLRTGRLEEAWALSVALSERTDEFFTGRICSVWRGVERESPDVFNADFDIKEAYDSFCSPE